ncbi:hypothetical protein Taro_042996 [Colocasia esculenta]|uniref:C3H1-type domain-containing protein n=1 Tax=Colocasia esculenta TaxID=4460 RepID=A0A843X3G8_COLES|nr:hypothetical protein [Colocasia esculenta]
MRQKRRVLTQVASDDDDETLPLESEVPYARVARRLVRIDDSTQALSDDDDEVAIGVTGAGVGHGGIGYMVPRFSLGKGVEPCVLPPPSLFFPPPMRSLFPPSLLKLTSGGTMNAVSSSEAPGGNHISNSKLQTQSSSSTQAMFPDRPDQPDCQYFMKTGSCKYGSSCKYHHPKEKIAQLAAGSMGPHMLPLRPGHAVCTYYSTYGNCKYGSACKFDHPYPLAGYYGYTYPALPMWDPSALFPYQRSSSMNWTTSNVSAPETVKVPDGFPKPESTSKKQNVDANMAEDQPPQAISPSQTAPSSESTQDQSD